MNRLQKNWTVMTFRFNRLTRIPSITVLGDFSDLCIHSLLLDPIYLAAAGSKYKISRPCLIVIESCFFLRLLFYKLGRFWHICHYIRLFVTAVV